MIIRGWRGITSIGNQRRSVDGSHGFVLPNARSARLTARNGSSPSPLTILPRSRHLPLASTDGSRTENLNKTGVRLWTDSSFDENCEISGRDALDALAHLADGPARPDERRRAIAPDARELRRASQRALDLQHQRGDMRRRFQQFARPSVERTARIEHDLDPGLKS